MNTHLTKDVLIVDDDEDVRTVVCTALTHGGLTCDTAADGVYALECLETSRYRVVLLDLVMPRLDGTGVPRSSVPFRFAMAIVRSCS